MSNNKEQISRYHLGEKLLIGYRDDHTLFWLITDKDYWNPKTDQLKVLEGGIAWIDKKYDTTILDFPVLDNVEIHRLENEFIQSNDVISHYKESDYFVRLSECPRFSPMKPKDDSIHFSYGHIGKDYKLPEHFEGYVLNEETFLRKDCKTGKLGYLKFSEFTVDDIINDRFGWIRAARQYFSISSDEYLIDDLQWFLKESYGDAWINEQNDVIVLGPICGQRVEVADNYFTNRICTYLEHYSEWNQTKHWIDIESGLKRNPFDYRVNYFYMLEKCIG